MPAQHKLSDMVGAEELTRKAKAIGAKIRALMAERGIKTNAELGEKLGITGNAVTKILGGSNTLSYAKLGRLAEVLETDPNTILDFDGGKGREAFRGAVEGALLALGRSRVEAEEIAAIALRVIGTPSTEGNPADNCRPVAEFLVRQFVDSKRQ